MKKLITFLIIFILIIPCICSPTYVEAKTLGDLKKELQELEKEKEEHDKEKQLTQQQIDQLHNELYEISVQRDQINKDFVRLTQEIEDLNVQIQEKDAEIREIINFLQLANGESFYLEYAFGAQDFTDFIYRLAVSEQLTNHNEELIKSYNDLIKENEQKKVELKQKEKELTESEKQASEKVAKLGEHLNAETDIKVSLEDKITAAKKNISMYENDLGCKDNEDLDTCGSQRTPTDTGFIRPITRGTVTSVWGNREYWLNGRLVRDFHFGYDISYPGNVPVYAAANGKVAMLVSRSSCGGNQIFIHHIVNGRKYTTIYAHLKSINVKAGQIVTPQTIIGYMGGNPAETYWDGCSTGQHLHFEITNGLVVNDYKYELFNAYAVNPGLYVNFPALGGYFNDRTSRY